MNGHIHGKTVYIIGAGASVDVGAPLLKDFLVSAKMLYYKGTIQDKRESFKLVFDWINTLRGASYYIDIDLDNIEHVFSLAEMHSQVGGNDGKVLCDALVDVITLTLDNSIEISARESHIEFSNSYSALAQKLKKNNGIRASHGENASENVFISFNYDPVLDYSFEELGVNYFLPGESKSGVKLLKLHGSTNWCICSMCEKGKNNIQSILTNNLNLVQLLDLGYRGLRNGRFPFEVFGRVVKNTACKYCQEKGVLRPFIIPPTWSKRVNNGALQAVWSQIIEELKDAYQIIVIGYSMPQTDTFFQYLLTLGLQWNSVLNRVIVVNPDRSPETESRYRRVFSRSMYERSRIEYKPVKFEEFLKDGISQYYSL